MFRRASEYIFLDLFYYYGHIFVDFNIIMIIFPSEINYPHQCLRQTCSVPYRTVGSRHPVTNAGIDTEMDPRLWAWSDTPSWHSLLDCFRQADREARWLRSWTYLSVNELACQLLQGWKRHVRVRYRLLPHKSNLHPKDTSPPHNFLRHLATCVCCCYRCYCALLSEHCQSQ